MAITSIILPNTAVFTSPVATLKVLRGNCVYDPQYEDITGVGDANIVMQQGGFIIVTGQLHCIAGNTSGDQGPEFATIVGTLKFATDAGEEISSAADGCYLMRKNHHFEYGSRGNKKLPVVLNYIMSNPVVQNDQTP